MERCWTRVRGRGGAMIFFTVSTIKYLHCGMERSNTIRFGLRRIEGLEVAMYLPHFEDAE
jgi:hypothetical protein